MAEDQTTLAVPKSFAEKLRENYDGHNDRERLENWALDCVEKGYNNSITRDDVREEIDEALQSLEIDRQTGELVLR